MNVKTDHIQLKSQLVVATNVRYKIQAVLDSGVIIYVFFYNLLEIPFLEMPAYFHALPSYKSKVQERTVPSRRTQSDAQPCRGASHCRVGLTFPSDAP